MKRLKLIVLLVWRKIVMKLKIYKSIQQIVAELGATYSIIPLYYSLQHYILYFSSNPIHL